MKNEKLSVCRCCFQTFPSSSVNPKWPMCPDCDSEAISVELILLRDFLASPDAGRLEEIREKVIGNTALYEHYRKTVAGRIDKLIKERNKLV